MTESHEHTAVSLPVESSGNRELERRVTPDGHPGPLGEVAPRRSGDEQGYLPIIELGRDGKDRRGWDLVIARATRSDRSHGRRSRRTRSV